MSVFVLVGALLVAAALLYIIPPLLSTRSASTVSRRAANICVYRDQLKELDADRSAGTLSVEDYEPARRELEALLLQDAAGEEAAPAGMRRCWTSAAVLVTALPVCAAAVYASVGTPRALELAPPRAPAHASQAPNPTQLRAMAMQLAERLQASPDDGEGWIMLARTYGALGQFGPAAAAYANASARLPGNASVLVDYADMLAMTQGKRLAGEPEALIAQALQIDPRHIKALALSGTAAFEKKNYAHAIAQWERALQLVPAESQAARSLQGSLGEARALTARVSKR